MSCACVCVCVCVCWKTLQLHNSCYVIHSVTLPNSECTETEIHLTCAALSVLCVTVSVKHRFSPVYMTWNRHAARDWWSHVKTCTIPAVSGQVHLSTDGPLHEVEADCFSVKTSYKMAINADNKYIHILFNIAVSLKNSHSNWKQTVTQY